MTYEELMQELFRGGWRRIERDDRLLDIFPAEDREKGIELWEHWKEDDVDLVRVRLPFDAKKLQLYRLSRPAFEKLLLTNIPAKLEDQLLLVNGEIVFSYLA